MPNPFSTESLAPTWTEATQILKGDLPGHEFHGNQHVAGIIAASNEAHLRGAALGARGGKTQTPADLAERKSLAERHLKIAGELAKIDPSTVLDSHALSRAIDGHTRAAKGFSSGFPNVDTHAALLGGGNQKPNFLHAEDEADFNEAKGIAERNPEMSQALLDRAAALRSGDTQGATEAQSRHDAALQEANNESINAWIRRNPNSPLD